MSFFILDKIESQNIIKTNFPNDTEDSLDTENTNNEVDISKVYNFFCSIICYGNTTLGRIIFCKLCYR